MRSFFPEMRDDEVLLLVQYDSRPQLPERPLTELEKREGGKGFIPPLHTAADCPARREVRLANMTCECLRRALALMAGGALGRAAAAVAGLPDGLPAAAGLHRRDRRPGRETVAGNEAAHALRCCTRVA